jgi:hypothetical protein
VELRKVRLCREPSVPMPIRFLLLSPPRFIACAVRPGTRPGSFTGASGSLRTAVFRLTGHHEGTEPNGSYMSPPVSWRSPALLISNAGQPLREER